MIIFLCHCVSLDGGVVTFIYLELNAYLTLLSMCLPSAVLEGPRKITPTVLKSSTGLEGVFYILSLTEVIYIFRTLCYC